MESLVLFRFCAGLGLGGAIPNALAFGSEYAPGRKRATLATAMYAGVAMGAVFAGLRASYQLPHYGWRSLFIVGGLASILIGLLVAFSMPESLAYLVQKGREADRAEIRRILSRLNPTPPVDHETRFAPEIKLPGAPIAHLFKEGRASNTVLPFAASPFAIVAVVSVVMGFFVIGSNSGLMALTSLTYHTGIRGTGLGWATGIGRIGSLVAPIAGGIMLAGNWSVDMICKTNALLALVVVGILFVMGARGPADQAGRIGGAAKGQPDSP
jgi:AAHS family 4-hydroxybenzoate transporter-like MFS transporter